MDREIILKTSVDVARIRRSCRVAERVIHALAPYVRPGFTTRELDRLGERFLRENGAVPCPMVKTVVGMMPPVPPILLRVAPR